MDLTSSGQIVLAVLAGCLTTLRCLFLARHLLSVADEANHVVVGERLWRSRLNPFDAVFSGQRMPLPLYLFGLTQLRGRSLATARALACVLAGAAVAVLTHITALRADALTAGLAALIVLCSSTLVGYWSSAVYGSLNSTLLLVGLWGLWTETPWAIVLSGVGLFLSRVNLWPALLVYSWWLRDDPQFLLALWLVPVVFFLWDRRHSRVLVYVDGLKWFGRWLGWDSVFRQGARPPDRAWRGWLRAGALFRWWWLLAGLSLPWSTFSGARDCAALFAVLFVTNAWRVRDHPRLLGPYLPCFLVLLAPLLASGWLASGAWPALTVLLAVSLWGNQHPLWVPRRWPLREVRAVAVRLRSLVPAGVAVGLWGDSLPVFLAGLDPPVGQIQGVFTPGSVWAAPSDVTRDADVCIIDLARSDHPDLTGWICLGVSEACRPARYAVYQRGARRISCPDSQT